MHARETFPYILRQQPLIFLLISTCLTSSQLITHHCKGHELQDAATASLLQTFNTFLYETLNKLGVRARHLGAHDR